jgi:MFS family permease
MRIGTEEDAMQPVTPSTADLTGYRRIMPILFIGVFMAALDAAIIAPAIPALREAFAVDNSQIGLVTIVYILCSLSSTTLMASLSDRYGRRPVYLTNIIMFAAGSLLIALAPSFSIVLVGRAIQGIAAGGVTPTASAVIGDTFPPSERGKALGLIGATFGMAFLIGPMVASLILVFLSWQWIFLLNVPIALVIIGMGWSRLPNTRAEGEQPPFDWAGLLTVSLMLTALILGVNQVLDRLLSLTLWPWLLGLALVCLPLLIGLEQRHERPVVPLSLFGTRQLQLTYILSVGAGFGMGSVIFITSIAVASHGADPSQAGFLLIPLVLASSVTSVWFGRLLNSLGSRTIMLIGFGTLGIGMAMLGLANFWWFMLATVLVGGGVGIVVGGTLRAIVLNEVAADQRATAQGLLNIAISVGNLLVVAVLGRIADSLGGGAVGLGRAYLIAAVITAVVFLLSLGLKSRQEEGYGLEVEAGSSAA